MASGSGRGKGRKAMPDPQPETALSGAAQLTWTPFVLGLRQANLPAPKAPASRPSARSTAGSTWAAGMSRMQRWWTRRQVGLWQGRQGTSVSVSIVAASGLSGAQCQGLVGPKMPTVGVPMAAATCSEAGIVRSRRRRQLRAPGWRCGGRSSQIARRRAGRADDLRGQRRFRRAAQHPDREALGGELLASSAK